ncbi:MAG TPA: hypothetical protein ENL20_11910, partial [Candidatus Cloacimonetes bacterium]|nr:hypothetical protein [Candidatus Cloacimonadota bacterium]
FTAENAFIGWHGLRFSNTNSQDSSKVVFCRLEYGKAEGTGLYEVFGGAIFLNQSSNVFIENCLITNNSAENGGGIFCYNSSPGIRNTTISNNDADYGGGMECYFFSNPNMNNVIISHNSAIEGGGFFCKNNSSPNMVNVSIESNYAHYGGGMFCNDASPNILNSNILNNNAGSDGGGMMITNNSSILLEDVNILYNNCNFQGGGIFFSNNNTTSTINNSTIAHNSSDDYDTSGGGISCRTTHLILNDVNITNNYSETYGGGIEINYESDVVMNNVIISRNNGYYGGGIYARSSLVLLSNVSIFYNTSDYRGGGIYSRCAVDDFLFNPLYRSNIYLNNSTNNQGNDIYAYGGMNVIVDTFTVLEPTEYYAAPIENFTFDILNARITFTESDLYVSPSGSDMNSGLTPDDPLRTIYQALNMIPPDNQNELNIYLAGGIYAPSLTGEFYPLEAIDHVSIIGESQNTTILDAEGTDYIFHCSEIDDFLISDIAIHNGYHTGNWGNGGGMFCDESGITIQNVTFSNNHSGYYGGAIYFTDCPNPILTNVIIKGNNADYYGGGIYFNDSNPQLSAVNIVENSTGILGGGLNFVNSIPTFDPENRCNIYLNDSPSFGNDICSNTDIDVIVDTFTVMNPDDYYTNPIENFTFDILHSIFLNINADLYVSPTGSDENSGLTPDDPLLTITYAYQIMSANQENLHTIFLANGTYSPSQTGESFPLDCSSFVTLMGTDRDLTILDAEGTSYLLNCRYSNSSIQNLTVKNGNAGGIRIRSHNCCLNNLLIFNNNTTGFGAGIHCYDSNPVLENLIVRNNSAESQGGGIFFNESNPVLSGISVFENNSNEYGGGLYFDNSSPVFDNENRCNIYLNNSDFLGNDIYSDDEIIDVIVDTFTVLIPDNFYAYPMNNFTFDILHSVIEQADQDLYVSPSGSDENSGLSADDPLKTINYAMSKITSNEESPHTIFLTEGIYSLSDTGENFPIIMKKYVSLVGENSETTILNGENLAQIIHSSFWENDFSLQGLTIANGNAVESSYSHGGGLFCFFSNCHISDVIFSNNIAYDGGGIYLYYGTFSLSNVIIENNSAEYKGGGIYCNGDCYVDNSSIRSNNSGENGGGIYFDFSDVVLDTVSIYDNNSEWSGGGIYFRSSNPILNSVTISENNSESSGGGFYLHESEATLNLVSINRNSAENHGGGIMMYNSELDFDSENRCSIYLNSTNDLYAKDIYSSGQDNIDVIVDTFSIDEPSDIYVYPANRFTFDIQNPLEELLDVDVYVSPSGSNYYSGTSPEYPFETIYYAMCSITADEENPRNIYLDEGEYSTQQVNGAFHLPGKSYVNIIGENPFTTIIEGSDYSEVFYLDNINDFSLQNISLRNGDPDIFYAENSDALLKNIIVSDNIENQRNVYCSNSNITLDRVLFHNNSTLNSGIYGISNSHLKILNCTITNNEITDSGNNISLASSDAEIVNTICWNNSSNEIGLYYGESILTVAYSDIRGGEDAIYEIGNDNIIHWLEGNIVVDPLFVDPENSNFHLQDDSPCIEAGTTFFEWNDEIIIDLSEDEYVGNAPDMGVYENENVLTDNELEFPAEYSLSQNYPNPFNPSGAGHSPQTHISYAIPIDS